MTDFEAKVLTLLDTATALFGAPLVQAVLNDVLGQGGGMLIKDASVFLGSIVRAAVEAIGESSVRERVAAAYDVADKATELAIDAKFRQKADTLPEGKK